jgi:hypothetical protein
MRYVPNQNGGFVGCWWHFIPLADKAEAYLQLAEGRLCFKVEVGQLVDQASIRNRFNQAVLAASAELHVPVRRPERLGKGNTMTVAVFDGDYRTRLPGTTLDWEYITSVIGQANAVLDRAVEIFKTGDAAIPPSRN